MAELSAFAQKSLEAKQEKILKELSRVAANRKCVDCDNIGPQYVITSYGVFVCTACGGLHRQYGHRVKGISMSRFSKEEIAALQDGGNEKFMATYCATWKTTALLRPTDRNPERTKAWIEEVYENKKFYSAAEGVNGVDVHGEETTATPTTAQANGHGTPSSTAGANEVADNSTITNEEDVVHVLELTDLGAGMTKLEIGSPVASPSASSSSPSKQPKSPPKATPKLQMPMPLSGAAAQPPSPAAKVVPSPAKSQTSSGPAEAAVEAAAAQGPAVAAPVVVAAPPPSIMDSWDPFGEVEPAVPSASTPEVVAPVAAVAVVVAAAPNGTPSLSNTPIPAPTQIVEDDSNGWNAFAEEVQAVIPEEGNKHIVEPSNTTPAALQTLLAPAAIAPPAAHQPAHSPPAAGGWAVDFGSQPQAPAPVPAPMPAPAPVATAPPPPLPTGRKEISLDTFYPEFETIRATGVLPTGQPLLQAQMTQWGVSSYSQQQQYAGGVVPPSPAAAGGHAYPGALPSPAGYPHQLSPHQQYHHQQQQQQYVSPSMIQSMPSPSLAPMPSPVGSVASSGRPASGASTASSHGQVGADPFAYLTPTGVGNQGQMQAAAMPNPSPSPPPPVAAAIPAVAPGSQTQAASATLFGIGTSMTAYDLSAPAAPKPRASGNPFA